MDRDFLRSRHYLVKQLSELRIHIHGLLRRQGHNFLQETGLKSYWTKLHLDWIENIIDKTSGRFKKKSGASLSTTQVDNSFIMEEKFDTPHLVQDKF